MELIKFCFNLWIELNFRLTRQNVHHVLALIVTFIRWAQALVRSQHHRYHRYKKSVHRLDHIVLWLNKIMTKKKNVGIMYVDSVCLFVQLSLQLNFSYEIEFNNFLCCFVYSSTFQRIIHNNMRWMQKFCVNQWVWHHHNVDCLLMLNANGWANWADHVKDNIRHANTHGIWIFRLIHKPNPQHFGLTAFCLFWREKFNISKQFTQTGSHNRTEQYFEDDDN